MDQETKDYLVSFFETTVAMEELKIAKAAAIEEMIPGYDIEGKTRESINKIMMLNKVIKKIKEE